MKNVLFTTTAALAVAAAGSASAGGHLDFGWSGTAEFGYYAGVDGEGKVDTDSGEVSAEAGFNISATTMLDNGVSASVSYGFDLDDNGAGSFTFDGDEDVEITVEGGNFKVVYGGENYAGAAGAVDNDNDNTLYVETSFNGVTAALSQRLTGTEDLEVGLSGSAGDLTWGLGYNDTTADGIFGISLGYDAGAFGVSLDADSEEGYDLTVSYDAGSFGASVSFEDDAVIDVELSGEAGAATFAVGVEDVTEDAGDMNPYAEVKYEMAPFTAYAGYSEVEGTTVAVEYDLGGDATLVLSYAEDLDLDGENYDDTYDEGLQAIVKFKF